jgi:hypothetical protein
MTPDRLRQLAQQYRELAEKSVVPEVKAQLAQWALEFETDAGGSFLTDGTVRPILNAMAASRREDGGEDQ